MGYMEIIDVVKILKNKGINTVMLRNDLFKDFPMLSIFTCQRNAYRWLHEGTIPSKKYRNWLRNNTTKDIIDIDSAQMIGEEYILTLLVENLNITKYPLNEYMGQKGEYITHYFGVRKYLNPIVPTEYLLTGIQNKTMI